MSAYINNISGESVSKPSVLPTYGVIVSKPMNTL